MGADLEMAIERVVAGKGQQKYGRYSEISCDPFYWQFFFFFFFFFSACPMVEVNHACCKLSCGQSHPKTCLGHEHSKGPDCVHLQSLIKAFPVC